MPVCASCQTDLSESARFCPNCGSAVAEPASMDSPTAAPNHYVSPLDGPSGIGGWMILVVLGLFVITGTALVEMISSLSYFNFISFIIYLILFAYGVVCIVLMFKKIPPVSQALYRFIVRQFWDYHNNDTVAERNGYRRIGRMVRSRRHIRRGADLDDVYADVQAGQEHVRPIVKAAIGRLRLTICQRSSGNQGQEIGAVRVVSFRQEVIGTERWEAIDAVQRVQDYMEAHIPKPTGQGGGIFSVAYRTNIQGASRQDAL